MFELPLIVVIVLLILIILFLLQKMKKIQSHAEEILFKKQSQSVKYGKMTEQFLPFIKEFPFNPETFRFLGSPVDGVAFEENKIILCEFKTASSQLSEKQKKIKKLVKDKKVDWFELNVK
jgi:predicted Holliday junction resolvase-like endonuclease